MGNYNYK